ncbi:MAG: hypothetical protein KKB38_20265 [Gammaproteobacteria bacterium]|nr:hypothetical protein [Gammaproteobacteria bacterium]
MNREDSYFVESGLDYDGVATTAITGLTHLIGEEVVILADGEIIEDEVVSDTGTITLTTAVSKYSIGLVYRSELQPMRPVFSTTMGTTAASIVGCHTMGVSLHNSDGVKYGTDTGDLYEINIDEIGLENTSGKEGLFTGVVDVSVEGGYDLDNNIRIVSDAPLPCIVRALIPDVVLTG